MKRTWLVLVSLFVMIPAAGIAQEISTSAVKLKIGGRVQVQAGTSTCSEYPTPSDSKCEAQVPATDLYLRRVRISIAGEIGDKFDFKIEPDYNKIQELGLKDAWGRITFSDLARVKVGNFKRPFDGFQLISSTIFPTVERAIIIRGLGTNVAPSYTAATTLFDLSDRDIGVELSGQTEEGMFSYWVGAFTGNSELKFQDTNNSKQFQGRGQFATEVAGLPLKIAAAASASDASYETISEGIQAEYYYNYELFADLGTFAGGPHLIAGYVFGDNPLQSVEGTPIDLALGEDFASFQTWQLIGAWRFDNDFLGLEAIEPVFRVTYGDPNTDLADDGGWGFTPGLQLYFYKLNRLSLSWDFASWDEPGIRGENSFKAQMQFHF